MAARAYRPARALALLLALAAVAGPVADAHHTRCDGQSNERGTATPCPGFAPQWLPRVSSYGSHGLLLPSPVTFAPSSVAFEISLPDHAAALVASRHVVPHEWSFAFSQLQDESPAVAPDGSPATSCAQIYDDATPRRVVGAEIVSGSPMLLVRTSEPEGDHRGDVRYEHGGEVSSNVAFLRWDDATGVADLCMQLLTGGAGDDPAAEDITMPLRIVRLPQRRGWAIEVDHRPLWRNATLRDREVSLIRQTVHLNRITAGNFHRNPVTGEREPIVFSRAPGTGINGVFGGAMTGCRRGLDVAHPSACRDGATITVTDEHVIPITPPPAGPPLGAGTLTGPMGLGDLGTQEATTAQYQGFGFVHGTDRAEISWRPPLLPPDTAVRGYVVVLAKPNVQGSRVFLRAISDPAAPGFDAGAPPCGADGLAEECRLAVRFPLTGVGGDVLHGDRVPLQDEGIYDVTLITIYDRIYQDGTWLADARRSDGRCDDGTGPGAWCDPTVAPPVLPSPGASYWRFMMRSRRWPQVFVQSGYARTPDGDRRPCSCAPHMTLLLDVPQRRAEFTIWEQQIGGAKLGGATGAVAPGTWDGASTLISGDERGAATIVWGGVNAGFGFWGALAGSSVRGRVLVAVRVDATGVRGRILDFLGRRAG